MHVRIVAALQRKTKTPILFKDPMILLERGVKYREV